SPWDRGVERSPGRARRPRGQADGGHRRLPAAPRDGPQETRARAEARHEARGAARRGQGREAGRGGDPMKLSDIMSAAGLAWFAEAALVLFMIAFVAVCISVFSKKNGPRLEKARYLPWEDTTS